MAKKSAKPKSASGPKAKPNPNPKPKSSPPAAKASEAGRDGAAGTEGAEASLRHGGTAPVRRARRHGVEVKLSPRDRVSLYAAARYIPSSTEEACHLKIAFQTYFKDPALARSDRKLAFDEAFMVNWEPGLTDGPTSARFAVVDYDGDTGQLSPPATWDEPRQLFTDGHEPVSKDHPEVPQFHQVSVWAVLQRALEFFESPDGLGRRIPWAFEGNRLIVVPHAGSGRNAFYDRESKSLQFYYFDADDGSTVYTCLSSDIVNHEFGHAVLDGIRPHLYESTLVETAAFHEFMGDLSAILLALRNTHLRKLLTAKADGDEGLRESEKVLASIATEFGLAVQNTPYLRSAANKLKMSDLGPTDEAHKVSQVMTGAMFDLLLELVGRYRAESQDEPGAAEPEGGAAHPKQTPAQALANAAQRLHRMAIQPLDLLPPVDVTFRDYALAVCRSVQIADPVDPHGLIDMLLKVFRKRGILDADDEKSIKGVRHLYERIQLSVYHDVGDISRSRAAAYRFLDDNREDLLIPAFQDFVIADLYDANKYNRQAARLPRQIILEYLWREDVKLDGPRFGRYDGQITSMLCGGTLVIDDNGNVLTWARKPGTQGYGPPGRGGALAERWAAAVEEGRGRRAAFLDGLAAQVALGRVGVAIATERGFLGSQLPPLIADTDGTKVRFRIAPHLHLSEDDQIQAQVDGARRWEISC